MTPQSIFTKTAKGVQEVKNRTIRLSRDLALVFLAVDGKTTVAELPKKTSFDEATVLRTIEKLAADGYIKIFQEQSADKTATDGDALDLDFTSPVAIAKLNVEATTRAQAEAAATARASVAAREAAEARTRQEVEARARGLAEQKVQTEAQARLKAEQAAQAAVQARAKAEAEADAATGTKAKVEAEARARAAIEAKVRAEAEARVRAEAENRAKIEAETKARAEARARAEAEAGIRAEIEAKARAGAEAKARAAVEAKMRAMEEALRQAEARAQAEAAARSVAEAEAKVRAEMEIKARNEAEARVRAAEEAAAQARAFAEAAAAAKVEAETKAKAAIEARADEARSSDQVAEQTKTDIKAIARAAEIAKLEALAKAEQAERALVEAQTKAKTEAAARAVAEARAQEQAEQRAQEDAEKLQREAELQIAREEAEARTRAKFKALEENIRSTREEATAKAESERKARKEAEARAEIEHKAREEAEARFEAALKASASAERLIRETTEKQTAEAQKAREEAEKVLSVTRVAHEQAVAKAQAETAARIHAEKKALTEKRARAAAEDRAKQETVARVMQEHQSRQRSDQEVRAKVEAEIKVRQLAEIEADMQARIDAQKRAEEMAAQRTREQRETPVNDDTIDLPHKSVKWGRAIGIMLVILIIIALGVLQIAPLSNYIPDTQQLLSERLQQPVLIGNLRFSLLPSPQLQLEQISIGTAQEIKIDAAVVPINPLTIFNAQKDFSEVRLSDVKIDQNAIKWLTGWANPQGKSRLHIGHIELTTVKLALSQVDLPAFDASLILAQDNSLQSATLHDAMLNVELQSPKDDGLHGNFSANNWTPPIGPSLQFSHLDGNVQADWQHVVISNLDGKFYGGSLNGNMAINWEGSLNAKGGFNLKDVDLEQLLPVFTQDFIASGMLDANAQFATQGNLLADLFAAPRISATFKLQNGALNNLDIVRAIQSSPRGGIRGGRTQFTELNGEVQVAGNRISYRNLKLNSGPMNGTGTVEVTPSSEISGHLNIQVGSQTAPIAHGVLGVGGSIKDPLLMLSQ